VKLVNQYDIVIIPFGGGTNVSGAVSCPVNESRCIVSVDTSQMVISVGIFGNINVLVTPGLADGIGNTRPNACGDI